MNKKNGVRGSLGEIGSQGSCSFDFDQEIRLDILIEKLLESLTKTKIELMEIDDESMIQENGQTRDFKIYFSEELKKYHKTLLLRESQLGSLVYVIENKNNEDFEQKYMLTYGELDKFIIQLGEAKKPINTVILEQAFETEIQFLREYSDMISLLKLNFVHKKYLGNMGGLKQTASRLKIIVIIF